MLQTLQQHRGPTLHLLEPKASSRNKWCRWSKSLNFNCLETSHASLEAHQTSRLYTTETVEGSCFKPKTHPKSTNKDNSNKKQKTCHLWTEGFRIKCIKWQGTLTLTQSQTQTLWNWEGIQQFRSRVQNAKKNNQRAAWYSSHDNIYV